MAAGAFDDTNVPSPEREIKNPPPNPHTDLYAVRKFSDIENALVKSTLLLDNLKDKIDSQTKSIDKILDKVHQIDLKIVEIDTKLIRTIEDYKLLDKKLDGVRTIVIGAAAIVTLLSVLLPPLIAKIPWFQPATLVQTDPPRLPRR